MKAKGKGKTAKEKHEFIKIILSGLDLELADT